MGALAPGLRIALDGSAAVTILVGLALVIRLERNLFDLSSGWAWAILIGIVTSVVAVASGAVASIGLQARRRRRGGRRSWSAFGQGDHAGAHNGGAGSNRRRLDGLGQVRLTLD